MDAGTITRYLSIPIILTTVWIWVYHLREAPALLKQIGRYGLMATILTILPTMNILKEAEGQPVPWLASSLGHVSLHYCTVCIVSMATMILSNEEGLPLRALVRGRLFLLTSLMTWVMFALDILRSAQYLSVTQVAPGVPPVSYLASSILYYGALGYAWTEGILLFRRYVPARFSELQRVSLALAALVMGLLSDVLAIANLVAMGLWPNHHGTHLVNWAIQFGFRNAIAVMLITHIVLPAAVIHGLLWPVTIWHRRRRSTTFDHLVYLYRALRDITGASEEDDLFTLGLATERTLLSEIGDLRDLVWGYTPYAANRLPTAQDEARLIHRLRQTKTIIAAQGPRTAPPVPTDLRAYYELMARALMRLEYTPLRLTRNGVSGPAPRPVLGHISHFQTNRLDFLVDLQARYGDRSRFFIGSHPVLFLNDPRDVHHILVEHDSQVRRLERLAKNLHPLVGDGLLTSEGEFHRRQRQLVAPTFRHRKITSYGNVFQTTTAELMAEWEDGQEVDIADAMMRLTLRIIGQIVFDADLVKEAPEVGAALTTVLTAINERTGALIPIPMSWKLPNQRFHQAVAQLDTLIYRLIEERRPTAATRTDLLSELLQMCDEEGTHMSARQVRDEVMTLFLAGHETTANALAWAWLHLGLYPDVYERMLAEVDQLTGQPITVENLTHLPYTLQVFKETLRLYPPAYLLGRTALAPLELADGYRLPEGQAILMSPYVLHRRPDVFPNPETFDPDRFTPDAERQIPRHAYLPFGAGPRVCIGNHLAMLEAHMILAMVAQRFRFELAPNQAATPEPMITLRPKHGVRVIVWSRTAVQGVDGNALKVQQV